MILFKSWHTSGQSNIYAVGNDGSHFCCLTSQYKLQRYQRLRMSPHRDHLLFYAVPHGKEIGRFFFWEFATKRLTEYKQEPYPNDLRWLTNDRLLCIKKGKLWMTDLAGSSTTGLEFAGSYLVIDIAPDGNRLVMLKEDGSRSIYVGNIDRREAHEIIRGKEYEKSHMICYPSAWSPDGRTIACVGGVEDEVWLVNADGSDPRKVADTDYFWRKFQWSPDGKKIAFTRSLDAGGPVTEIGGVFIKDLQSREEKQILTLRWSETWQWSADGQGIVFAKIEDDHYSLLRIDIQTDVLSELIGAIAALKDIAELIVV
jgi:Tol biopolymer transport system component